jgi:hypothetical protein
MNDAQLAVALGTGGRDWLWASFVQIETPSGPIVALAQLRENEGTLTPLYGRDRQAIEAIGSSQFRVTSRDGQSTRLSALATMRNSLSLVPLGIDIDVAGLRFEKRNPAEHGYSRIVYRGIALPGYTNRVWLDDGDDTARTHGYTSLYLFGRDIVLSEISKVSEDPDQWYLGVTISGAWLSQLELDALEMTLYLFAGVAGVRQCVESFDADAQPLGRSFHRLGHAGEREAKPMFPTEHYSRPEFYEMVGQVAESAKSLIGAGFPLRAILFRLFSSQQPVPEVNITELGIALDAIKNAVVVKIKGEGKLMEQKIFDERIKPVLDTTSKEFSSPEDAVALESILRRIEGANDWSDRQRWARFWRDYAGYQLTDRERAVLDHRDPLIHQGYVLQTEYDLALDKRSNVDRRPYEQRLRELDADARIFRNIVNRVLLRLLAYKGQFLDFTDFRIRLDTNRIVCLGWGSLIWDPRDLRLRTTERPWHQDGPELPIEFARQSLGGKITLVLSEDALPVPVLWADLDFEDLNEARANLTEREWSGGDPDAVVGVWTESTPVSSPYEDSISRWARQKKLDAVIWTKLPPRFGGVDGRVPSCQEVLTHLLALTRREKAEEYIRNAPVQIATRYRSEIEQRLGWTPDENVAGANIRSDLSK